MTALATFDDIPNSLGFTPEQAAQTQAALDAASAAVRAYCRRQFTAGSYTTRLRARGNWIVLPQRPVASVQTVKLFVNGLATTTTGWIWDGLDRVWIGNLGAVINLAEDLWDAVQAGVTVAEVTYTAGYATVPADVVQVVIGLVTRAIALPAGGVFVQESAGPFSHTVAAWARGGPFALSDSDRTILDQYRRAGSTVELRS